MQYGSITLEHRKRGPGVWSFKWREAGPDGRRVHRRMVLGSADDLSKHYQQRELVACNPRFSDSTKQSMPPT
jgi:hypothetical protein